MRDDRHGRTQYEHRRQRALPGRHPHHDPSGHERRDPRRRDRRIGRHHVGRRSLQGAANDIAPPEFPAAADPFLTVTLAEAAVALGVEHHVGITASTDTFFEGQERTSSSANPYLIRRHAGLTAELRDLGVLNFEMEAATLLKMGLVYGFAAGCVCAIIAQRTDREEPDLSRKDAAVAAAVGVAVDAADRWTARPATAVRYRA